MPTDASSIGSNLGLVYLKLGGRRARRSRSLEGEPPRARSGSGPRGQLSPRPRVRARRGSLRRGVSLVLAREPERSRDRDPGQPDRRRARRHSAAQRSSARRRPHADRDRCRGRWCQASRRPPTAIAVDDARSADGRRRPLAAERCTPVRASSSARQRTTSCGAGGVGSLASCRRRRDRAVCSTSARSIVRAPRSVRRRSRRSRRANGAAAAISPIRASTGARCTSPRLPHRLPRPSITQRSADGRDAVRPASRRRR